MKTVIKLKKEPKNGKKVKKIVIFWKKVKNWNFFEYKKKVLVVGRFDFYNVMVKNVMQTRCRNSFFWLPTHVKKSDFYKNKKSHGSKKSFLRSNFPKILKIENKKRTTQKMVFSIFWKSLKMVLVVHTCKIW